MFLGAVHQRAERTGRLEDVREIDRELAPGSHRGRGGIRRREAAEAQRLRQPRRVGGGHGRAVGIPHRKGAARKHPCAADLASVRRQAVGSGEIGQHDGTGERPATGARGPCPAVGGDLTGERRHQPEIDTPSLPRDPE